MSNNEFTPFTVMDDIDELYPQVNDSGVYIGGISVVSPEVEEVLRDFDSSLTLSGSSISAGSLSAGDPFPGWNDFRLF